MTINPIALRKAKMYAILAFLGAIGLKVLIIIPIFTYIYIKKKRICLNYILAYFQLRTVLHVAALSVLWTKIHVQSTPYAKSSRQVINLLHSEWPKLYGVLAILNAIG